MVQIFKQEVENPMIRPELPKRRIAERIECDCGGLAKMRFNGNDRCYDCADDEGVFVYYNYRRFGV